MSAAVPDGAAEVGPMRRSQFRVFMDTAVTIDVWSTLADSALAAAFDRAFARFAQLEETCSRFDPASELSRLSATVGHAVPISTPLFAALRFALAVAAATDGAYDPTVGDAMAGHGFNRNYRTGLSADPPTRRPAACFRDVYLDERRQEVTLARPLTLDLGSVVKGLALDLAALELADCGPCVIGAGGDFLFRGAPTTEPWLVDLRHPLDGRSSLRTLRVRDAAVCTSGAYERRHPDSGRGHLLDPRTGESALDVLSATVIASTGIMADALATAAFVMGCDGLSLIEQQGATAFLVLDDMTLVQTPGFARWLA